MNESNWTEQDQSVLKWGGLAGLIGSILFILVMVFVAVSIGPDPETPEGWVERFPDIHMARVIENGIYLTALLLHILLFTAMLWALRKDSPAPSVFGSVLGIVGLLSMIISATPHVAHSALSELYHTAGTSPETQEAIAAMWQGVWGVFNAPLYVGFVVVPIGILLLGIAMFASPIFNRGFGWTSMILGVGGLAAAIVQMIDPASFIGAVSYFSIIIFGFVTGLKLIGLSKQAVKS